MLGNRIKLSEFNINRMILAIKRRFAQIPNKISWMFPSAGSLENKKKLKSLHNLHKGERCFLIANGPSLKKMNLNLLKDEYTIGLNRIYLIFDKLVFLPSFCIAINELILDQFYDEIQNVKIPKFLNWNRRNLFKKYDQNNHYLNITLRINDVFTGNILKPISSGGTVTYVALQIAYFLGFNEIIIIGLDHDFVDKGVPNTLEKRNQEHDLNHFDPNYFPKGTNWQYPDLLRSEIAYKLADEAFKKNDRKIYDATIGGNCDVFEKIDFYEYLHTTQPS